MESVQDPETDKHLDRMIDEMIAEGDSSLTDKQIIEKLS